MAIIAKELHKRPHFEKSSSGEYKFVNHKWGNLDGTLALSIAQMSYWNINPDMWLLFNDHFTVLEDISTKAEYGVFYLDEKEFEVFSQSLINEMPLDNAEVSTHEEWREYFLKTFFLYGLIAGKKHQAFLDGINDVKGKRVGEKLSKFATFITELYPPDTDDHMEDLAIQAIAALASPIKR